MATARRNPSDGASWPASGAPYAGLLLQPVNFARAAFGRALRYLGQARGVEKNAAHRRIVFRTNSRLALRVAPRAGMEVAEGLDEAAEPALIRDLPKQCRLPQDELLHVRHVRTL
jgi:hypothetical protein